jgi:hypothetical protein
MNREEKRIAQYFQDMNLPLNEGAFLDFNNVEKRRLERLSERMHWLFDRLVNRQSPSASKFRLEKDEFRALEWIMWEMGLIDGEYEKLYLGHFNDDEGD